MLPDSVSRRLIPIQSARILMNERQFVPDPRPLHHAATKNPPGCSSSSLTTRPRRPLSSAFRLLTARCLPRLVHCTTCHSLVVVLYRQRWPSTNVVRCAALRPGPLSTPIDDRSLVPTLAAHLQPLVRLLLSPLVIKVCLSLVWWPIGTGAARATTTGGVGCTFLRSPSRLAAGFFLSSL